ncbi:MAG: hypothetical protein ACXWZE_14255 [Candidatus Binatia bacterium]
MLDIQYVTPELRGEPPPGEEVEIRSLQLDERERLRLVLHMHAGCSMEGTETRHQRVALA